MAKDYIATAPYQNGRKRAKNWNILRLYATAVRLLRLDMGTEQDLLSEIPLAKEASTSALSRDSAAQLGCKERAVQLQPQHVEKERSGAVFYRVCDLKTCV